MYLIPQPKKIEEKTTLVTYDAIAPFSGDIDERVKRIISKLPTKNDGAKLSIEIDGGVGEGYSLELLEKEIIIKAQSAKGAYYAVQTLRQIFKNAEIPCLYIEDKPDFEHRGFYHDITRGKVPTVKTLKELIDNMAYYKLNSLQLYVEHTFEFKEYKDSLDRTGYLTAEEIKELDQYCYENFIEFIPSLSTFGHLYELLQRDEYKKLCVLKNYEQETHFWPERMAHHTIDPTMDKSIEVIKSLIDQYIPLFRTDTFNICCDETFDLSKQFGEESGKLYIEFVNKIIDHVKKHGKKVMMWGDILLKYPETISELPEDICCLNWDYSADPKEERIMKFTETKKKQIVCPGTTTWNRFCEGVVIEEQNISKMAEYGYKHGAIGVLNTNWGDYGNTCSLELAMYGLAIGAEKSWSVNTLIDDAFGDKVNYLLYENENGIQYLKELSSLHDIVSWRSFVRHLSNCTFDKQLEAKLPEENDLVKVQDGCLRFINKLSKEKWTNDEYREEMLISAKAVCLTAELFAKSLGYSVKRTVDTKEWFLQYRDKWLQKNKESELSEIEKVFMWYENN